MGEGKKRVLLTGCTPQQTGSPVMIGYAAISAYVRWALEQEGWEVDQRPVVPGEDLGEGRYAAVVLGLTPMRGNPARHVYGMLWARRWARDAGLPVVNYVDDWQFNKVRREMLGSAARADETFFNDHKDKCRANIKVARTHSVELIQELRRMAAEAEAGDWGPTVYPGWSWGDREIVRASVPAARLEILDPGAWAYEICAAEYESLRHERAMSDAFHTLGSETFGVTPGTESRERRWVMAVLSDQAGWLKRQGFDWPVDWYGTRGPLGKVTEREIRERVLGAWGLLSPGYAHAGSGWWRVRAFDAALGGAVWMGGKPGRSGLREMSGMPGGDDVWHRDAGEIESMSAAELEGLAAEQLRSLEKAIVPKAEAARVLGRMLE